MNQKRILIPTDGPEAWRRLLAEPVKHWKLDYSAMSIANSWEKAKGVPSEILALFKNSSEAELQDATLALAIPEYKVNLSGGTRPSQNDVFALLTCSGGLISAMIEGKAREDFDVNLADWKKKTSAKGANARLSQLMSCLGLTTPVPDDIRYQLLHRTASAIIEADRFHAPHAVMVVQSFVSKDTENHYSDFCAFIRLFGKEPCKGSLIEISCPHGRRLFAAWVQSKPALNVETPRNRTDFTGKKGNWDWQKILEIGAEGGSITLNGCKDVHGEWWFSRHNDERTMKGLLSEEDQDGLEFESFSEKVKGWDGALYILSRYPWTRLYPLYVHPEFAERVMFEVKNVTAGGDSWDMSIEEWERVCVGKNNW